MDLELNVIATEATYSHIALVGRLDIEGAGAIENKFLGHTAARKVDALVDLSGITFLGSMGMRVLISAAKGLRQSGKKLVLFGAQSSVEKALGVSGIGHIIDIVPDEAAARSIAGI